MCYRSKENEGNYIVQLISDESYIYGLSLNNTVYRINSLASEVIKNNIKLIINNRYALKLRFAFTIKNDNSR